MFTNVKNDIIYRDSNFDISHTDCNCPVTETGNSKKQPTVARRAQAAEQGEQTQATPGFSYASYTRTQALGSFVNNSIDLNQL